MSATLTASQAELADQPGEALAPAARSPRRPVADLAWPVAFAAGWFVLLVAFLALVLHVDDPATPAWAAIRQVLTSWDGQWYLGIAEHGYQWNPASTAMQNPSFYPGYPMLIAVAHVLGIPWSGAAVAVSVVAQCGAAAALGWLCRVEHASEQETRAVVALYVLFPAGIFAALGYSTSLGCLLGFVAVAAWRSDRRWLAAVAAGLGTAVGPMGLIVSAGLVLYEVATSGFRVGLRPAALARYLTSFAGIAGFSAYLGVAVNDPTAFYKAVSAWAPSTALSTVVGRVLTLEPIRSTILGYLQHPLENWFMYFQDALLSVALLGVLVVLAWRGRRMGPAFLVCALGLALDLAQGARIGALWSGTRIVYPVIFLLAPIPLVRRAIAGRAAPLLLAASACVSLGWMFLLAHGAWVE